VGPRSVTGQGDGELHLYAVPEPLCWLVLVELRGPDGAEVDGDPIVLREIPVERSLAPTQEEALAHVERCLRGEIAEGLWSPRRPV
jgi:hypothetical protein